MDNIEAFDYIVAKIFAKLYSKFPQKLTIDCDSFCEELEIIDYTHEEKIKLCGATMIFLQENDFIISRSPNNSTGFSYVSLTMKGLSALKSEPQSLKNNESIGKKLIKAVESGSTDLAVHMAQNILNVLFKL